MKRKIPGIQLARRISLGVILAVVTVMTVLHQLLKDIPSIDAICPFGGIETLYKFAAGGELVKRIEPSNIVMLALVVIIGIVLSRFFCGWICAFGALQGIFGSLGRKVFKKRFTVPQKLDSVLRWFKYVVLVAIVAGSWITGTLIIRPYDPWAAYGHLSAGLGAVWAEFAIGFIILVLSLLLSMLYERAFCKYVCPLGAFNAILSRIPLFRIRREASTCISCSKCDRACPMNIDVMKPDAVNSAECIACFECVTTCPTKKGTLKTFLAGKPVRMGIIALIGLGLYVGTLGIGYLSGLVRFTPIPLSQKAIEDGLMIEDIKGSSTWGEVAESFGVEPERLYRKAGVDGSKVPPETKLKDTGALIGVKDFEADTVRIALAEILGVPYAGEGGKLEPKPAETNATEPVATEAPAPAAVTAPAAEPAPAAKPAPAASNAALKAPADFALEGTMTIKDTASALGWTPAQVIAKLGLPADIPQDKPLRDMKDGYGYTMPVLKTRILE